MKIHELTCPQCGNTQEVTVWDSLNVSMICSGVGAFFFILPASRAVVYSSPEYNSTSGPIFGGQARRGRCLDNIFVERLWRTVKQKNIYLNNYANVSETRNGLNEYFRFYNKRRRHQSLDYLTPKEVHFR